MSVQKLSLFALFVALVAAGCSSQPAGQTNDSTAVQTETQDQTVADEVEKIIYPLPTPYKISEMLNKAGAGYIFYVSNPVENVDKYFTDKRKALNLGVYGADLSYASTYNKSQETQLFLTCTQQLTEELGITSAFNTNLVERVEANINNKDSLHHIISESYYDTFDYLNKNGKGSISVIILAGGWIEGMYLSTQLAIVTKNDNAIVAGIGEQKETLSKLVTILKTYKDDPSVTEVMADLERINAAFPEVEAGKTLTPEQLSSLTSVIEEVRNAIIE